LGQKPEAFSTSATLRVLPPKSRCNRSGGILFSDILIVPDALGQGVRFVEGEGPRLDPIRTLEDLSRLAVSRTHDKFALICETVERLRQELPRETALILIGVGIGKHVRAERQGLGVSGIRVACPRDTDESSL
jgi:hypothetical protein